MSRIESSVTLKMLKQWVHSMNAVQTLTNNLRRMSGDSDSVHMTHKEEANHRMLQDAEHRWSIRKIPETCVDPMDPDSHKAGTLLNISTGQIAELQLMLTAQ